MRSPAAKLSARGSADGSVTLPAGLALGDYVLSARTARTSGTASFAIEEYRKPEFSVEVTPDREVVVSGDEVRFQVAANYFFGAPVFGALVRYNLFESRLDRDERGFEEEFGEMPEVGFGRVLKTGETRTDIDGRAVLTFTPERVAYDRRLTLEVEVVDAANRQVRGRGSVIVGRALFRVTVRPLSRLVLAGEPVRVAVLTRDHLGKPVRAAVQVTLEQDSWNPIERRYTRSTRALASAVVITDTSGRGSASLTPEPARSGNLTVRGRAQDAKNNVVTDEATVWVYDRKIWQYAYRYPTLEAFADRERYQPGDTARIVVNTDVAYAAVLATLEGKELLDHRVVHLFGNTGLVSFPIRSDQAPNVYVAIHVRKGKEILSRVIDLAVSGERHDLQIRLRPDRAEYRPQDEARVGIETRDAQGAAVAAEVSLGVVDEAIYALRPDATPKPHDSFYGHRPNWVSTVVSFPALYLGGASKTDREVRRDFRDVAFWAPAVLTGDDGRAEVSFRFPDNLTTCRLTSRGATPSTLVGEAVAKVLVTKDLVARLAPPRLLVAGDLASLVSVVNNRTAQPLANVEESFEAGGAAVAKGPKSTRSSIPARGEARHTWPIEAMRDPGRADADSAEAILTYRVRSANDRDALEVRVPVRPRAVPLYLRGSAIVTEARREIGVPLPSNLVRYGSEVRLDLSPSPAAMALTATNALADYPWGCTEQTANVVRPALALLAALPAGASPPGWEDAERRLAPYFARLAALQNQEGGWGWWEGDESDPYMTVLAMNALARAVARDLGGERVRSAIQRAGYPLQRALGGALTLDGQAYVLAHLSSVIAVLTDQGMSDLRPRLEDLALLVYSSRDRLSDAGLALATRAHADLGRAAEAKTLIALLLSKAEKDGGTHWPAAFDESHWFGEAEENTGYALSALLAVDPANDRIDDIVQWLGRRRTGRFWRTTRTTAPVAIALAEYLAKRPAETRPDYRLVVLWNGEQVLDRTVTSANLFAPGMSVRIPGRSLRAGENRLTVTKQGAGRLSVAWEATAMVPSPGPETSGAPLTLTRSYLRAERTSDRRGRPQYLSVPLEPGRTFGVGDLVMVRLALHASRALDYVMIQDPRPAGFEIDALTPEGVERPWNAHAEERDDRIAFFLDHVESGETVIEYLYRPELEGRLIALPTAVAQMYEPDWVQRGAEAILEVKGK